MNWTDYFRNIAEVVKLKSKDINTQIGAVIVGESNEIVSTGYNSFPRGINDNVEERQHRPEKYYWTTHAEINAIVNAARIGVSTNNTKMYLTCNVPCTDCTRAIINSGISEIYCTVNGEPSQQIWKEHEIRSLQMFAEAGVKINYYEN